MTSINIAIRKIIHISLLVVIFSDFGFAQNIKKVYKHISKNEIEDATIELNKFPSSIISKNTETALILFANSLLVCNKETKNSDPYRSLMIYKSVDWANSYLTEINSFLEKYDLSVNGVRDAILSKILELAKKQNTESSYTRALDVCADCFYKEEVTKLQLLSAYNEAKGNATLSSYKAFLTKYPTSKYADEIFDLMEPIEFSIAKSTNTLAGYSNYIQDYFGRKNKLLPLVLNLRDSIIFFSFEQNAASYSLEGKIANYKNFIDKNPNSKYYTPAKKKLSSLLVKNRIEVLKNTIKSTQPMYQSTLPSQDENGFFYDFPKKYYNGNQPFHSYAENDGEKPCLNIVNSNGNVTALVNFDGWHRQQKYYLETSVLAVGTSQKTERFSYRGFADIPDIKSSSFQEIGDGISSYDRKRSLITRTFQVQFQQETAYPKFISTNVIGFDKIFPENVNIEDFKYTYSSRLSNNDILVILEANIEFLSNQLNRMFGVDGIGKISRTFQKSTYYKFLIISADGLVIKSNINYLIPIKYVRPIENGFVVVADNLSEAIKLDDNDFGRKITVYSQAEGKNIVATEAVNFNNVEKGIRGVKMIKFNNTGDFEKEITIDNPSDININKPYLVHVDDSENYLCVLYVGYDEEIANEGVFISKLFDFDFNLKSKIVLGKTNEFKSYHINGQLDIDSRLSITSKDDLFYLNILSGDWKKEIQSQVIPFDYIRTTNSRSKTVEKNDNEEIYVDESMKNAGQTNARKEPIKRTEEAAFLWVDKMPEFPNGAYALKVFIAQVMKYPDKAKEKHIQGKVSVEYIVEKDGTITNVKISSINKGDPMLFEEALRIVNNLPKMNAGIKDGKPVRVKDLLDIDFEL